MNEFHKYVNRSGPKVVLLVSCSIHMTMKFILLINFKMPFISKLITTEFFKQEKSVHLLFEIELLPECLVLIFFILFVLILYIPANILSVTPGQGFQHLNISLVHISKFLERKIIINFSPISLKLCFGGSNESSQSDDSFEYPKRMFWFRIKKNKCTNFNSTFSSRGLHLCLV